MLSKILALAAVASLAPTASARWTGNVMFVNLMSNYSIDFLVSTPTLYFALLGGVARESLAAARPKKPLVNLSVHTRPTVLVQLHPCQLRLCMCNAVRVSLTRMAGCALLIYLTLRLTITCDLDFRRFLFRFLPLKTHGVTTIVPCTFASTAQLKEKVGMPPPPFKSSLKRS